MKKEKDTDNQDICDGSSMDEKFLNFLSRGNRIHPNTISQFRKFKRSFEQTSDSNWSNLFPQIHNSST